MPFDAQAAAAAGATDRGDARRAVGGWLLAVAAMVWFMVALGGATRLTGSGLGCPDWPKCYGQAVAPLETHAIIEYGNRLL